MWHRECCRACEGCLQYGPAFHGFSSEVTVFRWACGCGIGRLARSRRTVISVRTRALRVQIIALVKGKSTRRAAFVAAGLHSSCVFIDARPETDIIRVMAHPCGGI